MNSRQCFLYNEVSFAVETVFLYWNYEMAFCRFEILESHDQRQSVDGLNNVKYTLVDFKELPLYTYMSVRVNIIDAETYLRSIGYHMVWLNWLNAVHSDNSLHSLCFVICSGGLVQINFTYIKQAYLIGTWPGK